jgi:hypothetical protein
MAGMVFQRDHAGRKGVESRHVLHFNLDPAVEHARQ